MVNVVVTKVEDIGARCIDVFCTGPKGGEQNWVVHFDRHDRVVFAVQHKPFNGQIDKHLIPPEIQAEAERLYHECY